MAVGIRTSLQKHHFHVQRICGPQDRAKISGVLDPVQQQHSRFRHKGRLFRQPAQKQGALGRFHRGNGGHNFLRHPNNPNMLRNLCLYPVRQDHSIQTRAITHSFIQKLGPVCNKQACLLPFPPGRDQSAYLLQKRIFSGRDTNFCHNFLTIFTKNTCVLQIIYDSFRHSTPRIHHIIPNSLPFASSFPFLSPQ